MTEGKRGCGYRKTGGLYLMSYENLFSCGRLPVPLTVCPTCGHGIRPARGWTWVDGFALIEVVADKPCENKPCGSCAVQMLIDGKIQRAGLIWIGEAHYPTPRDFSKEAAEMGISRRITVIPRGFKVGETWVLLAHRKAILHPLTHGEDPEWTPGIFMVFKPTHVEKVVDEDITEEEIEALEKRGITPVIVEHNNGPETADLFDPDDEDEEIEDDLPF